MKAFTLDFKAYVIAEDLPDALKKADALRALAKANRIEPGVPRVRGVSDRELASLPALQRAVELATRPKYGPGCSVTERQEALAALAAANGGSLDIAQDALLSLERALGYLPRDVARGMRDRALHPATSAGAGSA